MSCFPSSSFSWVQLQRSPKGLRCHCELLRPSFLCHNSSYQTGAAAGPGNNTSVNDCHAGRQFPMYWTACLVPLHYRLTRCNGDGLALAPVQSQCSRHHCQFNPFPVQNHESFYTCSPWECPTKVSSSSHFHPSFLLLLLDRMRKIGQLPLPGSCFLRPSSAMQQEMPSLSRKG